MINPDINFTSNELKNAQVVPPSEILPSIKSKAFNEILNDIRDYIGKKNYKLIADFDNGFYKPRNPNILLSLIDRASQFYNDAAQRENLPEEQIQSILYLFSGIKNLINALPKFKNDTQIEILVVSMLGNILKCIHE